MCVQIVFNDAKLRQFFGLCFALTVNVELGPVSGLSDPVCGDALVSASVLDADSADVDVTDDVSVRRVLPN